MINEELLDKYLILRVDETYALDLCKILEIIEYKTVTSVPETPAYIAGMINLRGRVIPIIDLRERFKKAPNPALRRRCIVIVNFDGLELGLIADNVLDLIRIEPEKILPPPTVGGDYAHVFIKAIGVCGEDMHLILDSGKLVNLSELSFLEDTDV